MSHFGNSFLLPILFLFYSCVCEFSEKDESEGQLRMLIVFITYTALLDYDRNSPRWMLPHGTDTHSTTFFRKPQFRIDIFHVPFKTLAVQLLSQLHSRTHISKWFSNQIFLDLIIVLFVVIQPNFCNPHGVIWHCVTFWIWTIWPPLTKEMPHSRTWDDL